MRKITTPFDNPILRHFAGKHEINSASTIAWAESEAVSPFVRNNEFSMHIDIHPITSLWEKLGEVAERCFVSQGLPVVFKKLEYNQAIHRGTLDFVITEEVTPEMRQKLTNVVKAICYRADQFHRKYEEGRGR